MVSKAPGAQQNCVRGRNTECHLLWETEFPQQASSAGFRLVGQLRPPDHTSQGTG